MGGQTYHGVIAMQEMQFPDGRLSREFFSDREVLDGTAKRRRKELESQGATFLRMVWVDRNKYMPHQSKKETARRVRQMATPA